ncbi:MAG: hypothetical protein P1P87_15375 [Trueperaceae bacterium]|nr:hypothetical protein [Trueperaceae bacterium]
MTGPDARPDAVGGPVSVPGLARAAGERGAPIPGRPWATARLERPVAWRLERARWLLALDAPLIVDLPFGDFRVLQRGDALELPAGLDVRVQPVRDAVTALWHDDPA